MDRRSLLAAGAALGVTGLLPRAAAAQAATTAPAAPGQAPGFYRFKVGAYTATVVHDGFARRPNPTQGFVRNAEPAQVEAALREGFLPTAHLDIPFSVTFLQTPRGLIAFDSGTGGQLAPTAGQIPANMRAAGLDPAAVNLVIISHFHGDHIVGLTDAQNAVSFPNAQVVVPEAEWAFWMDDGQMSRAPEAMRGGFMAVRRKFGAYGDKVSRYAPGAEFAPGVRAVATVGHTPGHTSFLVTDGSDSLMVLGDLTNRPELNLRNPDWQLVFDMDPTVAAATRRRVLDQVSADRTRVIGYHFPFPANGYVLQDGTGYRFAPADWSSAA